MTYIRTKEYIFKLDHENYDALGRLREYVIWDEDGELTCINARKCVKKSDNLRDLIDEYVFEGVDGPMLCDFFRYADNGDKDGFNELVYWYNYSEAEQYVVRNCYGSIWTKTGLTHVAKMVNGKGDMKLICP